VESRWNLANASVKQLTTTKNTTFAAKNVWTALKRTLKNIQNKKPS
jgi:hypothetical protein